MTTALGFDPNPTLLFRADLSDVTEQYERYATYLDSTVPGWHLGNLDRLTPSLRREALRRRAANIRHATAPMPLACRWCGVVEQDHGQRWVAGHGTHVYVMPTLAQREARLRVKLAANRKPTPNAKEA